MSNTKTTEPEPAGRRQQPIVSKYADEVTQKALIAACNLLCEHADKRLPTADWEIRLSMSKGEATMSLIDPSGKEVEADSADYGIATIDDFCVLANDRHDWDYESC